MGHREVVRLLLEKGADPFMRTQNSANAWDIARTANHPEIIQMLDGKHISFSFSQFRSCPFSLFSFS
jgi:ankyrin repeat protein